MQAQYVAARPSTNAPFEALESHFRPLQRDGFIFNKDSTMLPTGISQEALTSSKDASAHSVSKHPISSNRRHRCQRASNYWQHSALSLLLLPVRASSRSKNLSCLTQPLFRLSQCRQANTSNLPKGNLSTKWAVAPTSTTSPNFCPIFGSIAGGAVSC